MLSKVYVDVEGAKKNEMSWAKNIAMKIYQMTTQILESGIADDFDIALLGNEYYGELMMNIADVCSRWIGVKNKRILKLCGGANCFTKVSTGKKYKGEEVYEGHIKCKIEDYHDA